MGAGPRAASEVRGPKGSRSDLYAAAGYHTGATGHYCGATRDVPDRWEGLVFGWSEVAIRERSAERAGSTASLEDCFFGPRDFDRDEISDRLLFKEPERFLEVRHATGWR